MRAERYRGGFEAHSRPGARLKEQQGDGPPSDVRGLRAGLEIVRQRTEFVDVVDGERACAQDVPQHSGLRLPGSVVAWF